HTERSANRATPTRTGGTLPGHLPHSGGLGPACPAPAGGRLEGCGRLLVRRSVVRRRPRDGPPHGPNRAAVPPPPPCFLPCTGRTGRRRPRSGALAGGPRSGCDHPPRAPKGALAVPYFSSGQEDLQMRHTHLAVEDLSYEAQRVQFEFMTN